MRKLDSLRPLTAGRVLQLWREAKENAQDPLERALLCNAAILAECCRFQGKPVYESPLEALGDLTGREMEALLVRLADGGGEASLEAGDFGEINPAFDAARFQELRKE